MNTSTLKIAVLLPALSLPSQSCKKESDKVAKAEHHLCTNNGYARYVNVGHQLTYEYRSDISDFTMFLHEYVSITDSGSLYCKTTFTGPSGSGVYTRYLRECDDWLLFSYDNPVLSVQDRQFKLLRAKGDTWLVAGIRYRVAEKLVNVTTAAGIFACDMLTIRPESSETAVYDTVYYSNEIGIVKYASSWMNYQLKSKNF